MERFGTFQQKTHVATSQPSDTAEGVSSALSQMSEGGNLTRNALLGLTKGALVNLTRNSVTYECHNCAQVWAPPEKACRDVWLQHPTPARLERYSQRNPANGGLVQRGVEGRGAHLKNITADTTTATRFMVLATLNVTGLTPWSNTM